jgi:hypothetical protein
MSLLPPLLTPLLLSERTGVDPRPVLLVALFVLVFLLAPWLGLTGRSWLRMSGRGTQVIGWFFLLVALLLGLGGLWLATILLLQ